MENLVLNGYQIVNFDCLEQIFEIQNIIKETLGCDPTDFHTNDIERDDYLILVNEAKNKIVKKQLIKQILLKKIDYLRNILGPDIDMQADIHLRVSRPNKDTDLVGWHRDTFYGNSYWEINLWFPIFPLEKETGLLLIDKSHFLPSKNIRVIGGTEASSQSIKGSLANKLGYAYLTKTDDVIAARNENDTKLITPQLGQCVVFLGYMAHRAQNKSHKTRVSTDLRLKSMLAPTQTRPGYFQPLTRSPLTNWIEQITLINQE